MASCPKNALLVQLGNLGQNYATLYLRQLWLMICFLRILKCSGVMGFNINDQSNVCQFTQKIPFQVRAIDPWFGPKLPNLKFHDSLSENCFEILWHYAAQYMEKRNISQFSKIISFLSNMVPAWPKITQLILTALKIFRNILAWWDATVRHY